VNLDSWLESALKHQKEKNLFRELKNPVGLIDFCSNDYLGLARSEVLSRAIYRRSENFGDKKNGATGSRLLSGSSKLVETLELKLAKIFKSEAVLVVNSGYTANLAIFSCLPQRNDSIIYDELAHASIKDGARLSLAKKFNFRHNDLNNLEDKLKRATGKIYVAVESVYSMDGDECPLKDLVGLTSKYGAFVVLDEAHSTGIRGANGSGIATSCEFVDDIDVRLYTFGKAMGTHGACIAGSRALINYIINFARPFIYTTALPPHCIAAIDCAFDYLSENMQLQSVLAENINTFLSGLGRLPNRTPSISAIQTLIVPGNSQVKAAASALQSHKFDIRPILSPTVRTGSERLRICIHTYNTSEEITKLTSELKEL
jgi:8-amino-7-oxononanoate synthase